MKTSAVLSLLLSALLLFRAASPIHYLRILSSLINIGSVLSGALPRSNFLCLKIIIQRC